MGRNLVIQILGLGYINHVTLTQLLQNKGRSDLTLGPQMCTVLYEVAKEGETAILPY